MEERLDELEMRYMHQQELLEQLNQVVIAHEREITRLARELRELRGSVSNDSFREGSMPADDKPPHY